MFRTINSIHDPRMTDAPEDAFTSTRMTGRSCVIARESVLYLQLDTDYGPNNLSEAFLDEARLQNPTCAPLQFPELLRPR
jgi:hypothetical protein